MRSTNPPSRFLEQDPDTKYWHEIGERRARQKVSHKIRERDKVSHKVKARATEKRRVHEASVALTLLAGGQVETNSTSTTPSNAEYEDINLFAIPNGNKIEDMEPKDLVELNAAFNKSFAQAPKSNGVLFLESESVSNSKVPAEKEYEQKAHEMSRHGALTKVPVIKRASPPSKHAVTSVKPSDRLSTRLPESEYLTHPTKSDVLCESGYEYENYRKYNL